MKTLLEAKLFIKHFEENIEGFWQAESKLDYIAMEKHANIINDEALLFRYDSARRFVNRYYSK